MAQIQPRRDTAPQQAAPLAREAQPTMADLVPDRPWCAPQVQLCGELPANGFAARLWLVQRGDKFLQLTDVLYRILEQANGQRTLDEIAAGVSAALGRGVSTTSVRQLIATKLIPKGLVAKADGAVEGVDAPTGMLRSPLAVNLRLLAVSPRHLEPIARMLQVLFMPPILVALLLLAAVGHAWVYVAHGGSQSMQSVLERPELLLGLLPLSLASALFHEFGHAAALHYSGGRARGIGVGFYLSYPVFYTDVTDSYRLGRWARVRTDLGGLYFNLIFELGVLALYFLTGHEFFVLTVVVLDFVILNELMPYARFDGYWALADLTGIPDFFTLMGPFVRSVVPVPWWKGPRLPQLKGWVKAVFGLYLLVSVPLLHYMLALLIKNVPRMVGAIWPALLQQTTAFARALDAGEILGMALAIVQMLILVLTTFGVLLVLFNVGYRAFRVLWSWSRPTPGRRVIGVLIASGVGALVAFLWVPQLPVPGGTPTRQDPQAQTVAIERQAPTSPPTAVPSVTPTVPPPTLTTAQSATSAAAPSPVPSTIPTTSQPAPLAVFQQVLEAEADSAHGQFEAVSNRSR